jgi:hypothetical protein
MTAILKERVKINIKETKRLMARYFKNHDDPAYNFWRGVLKGEEESLTAIEDVAMVIMKRIEDKRKQLHDKVKLKSKSYVENYIAGLEQSLHLLIGKAGMVDQRKQWLIPLEDEKQQNHNVALNSLKDEGGECKCEVDMCNDWGQTIDKSNCPIHGKVIQVPEITINKYIWYPQQIVPECDSCHVGQAEWKLHTKDVGIRLCSTCLEELKVKLGINPKVGRRRQ